MSCMKSATKMREFSVSKKTMQSTFIITANGIALLDQPPRSRKRLHCVQVVFVAKSGITEGVEGKKEQLQLFRVAQ